MAQVKKCIQCNQSKPLEMFSKNLLKRGAYLHSWYSQGCKECINRTAKLLRKLKRSHEGLPLKERFEQYFEKTNGCWIWKGGTASANGMKRGTFNIKRANGKRSPEPAYRTSWKLYVGEIPDGISVCHRCDNELCINPDHLFLATHRENMLDMFLKGRNKVGIKKNDRLLRA